jgi:NAD(P)-dependent dehydrogenase (short-subunit alcohol dehydrogenase family)
MAATKRAAVIGASGAIGRALVKQLCHDPCIQAIYTLSSSPTHFHLAKTQNILIDYHSENSMQEAATAAGRAGPLDLILITTGILHTKTSSPEKSLRNLSSDQFQELFLANTTVPAMLAKYFLPKLNKKDRSVFAALSARVGSISDNRRGGWYAYRASKAALNMIIKNAAIETARSNKQAIVVTLHPGTVDSPLSKPFQANLPAGQLFTPDQAATHLLNTINGLTTHDNGNCFAWNGEEILP